MGKQTNLKLATTAANLIFYERLGGHYIRSKPTTVKRTAATKASAIKFGEAIRLCKATRQALAPLLPGINNKPLMHRLNNSYYQWLLGNNAGNGNALQSITQLKGFELNESSSCIKLLKIKLQSNWQSPSQVQLLVPAFNPVKSIIAPASTATISLQALLIAVDIPTATVTAVNSIQSLFEYKDVSESPRVITLPYTLSSQQVYVLAVALGYHRATAFATVLENEVKWLPAMILEAMYYLPGLPT